MVNKSIIVEMQVSRLDELNDRRFNRGDIVFFINGLDVDWGEVLEIYDDKYGLQVYETKDLRLLNGIPIDEYKFDDKYHKLPKGWTWDTPLYDLSIDTGKFIGITLPKTVDEIRHCIDIGFFVKPSDQSKNYLVDAEVNKNGYRLVFRYDSGYFHKIDWIGNRRNSNYRSIPFYNCFATYEETQDVISQYKKEIESQANMTDREWCLYEIRRVAERCNYSESEVNYIINMFERDHKLEKIEVRNSLGTLEWKYEDQRTWQRVVI